MQMFKPIKSKIRTIHRKSRLIKVLPHRELVKLKNDC